MSEDIKKVKLTIIRRGLVGLCAAIYAGRIRLEPLVINELESRGSDKYYLVT